MSGTWGWRCFYRRVLTFVAVRLRVRAHEQPSEHDRDEEERRHITHEVPVMDGRRRPHGHDATVRDAGPMQ
jgi:hypothetical protein